MRSGSSLPADSARYTQSSVSSQRIALWACGIAVGMAVSALWSAGFLPMDPAAGVVGWFMTAIMAVITRPKLGPYIQVRRFGPVVVTIEDAPARAGDVLHALIETGIAGTARGDGYIHVECMRRTLEERDDGEDGTTTTVVDDDIWGATRRVQGVPSERGLAFALSIPLPQDARPSTLTLPPRSEPGIWWRIRIDLDRGGSAYEAFVAFPVLSAADAARVDERPV